MNYREEALKQVLELEDSVRNMLNVLGAAIPSSNPATIVIINAIQSRIIVLTNLLQNPTERRVSITSNASNKTYSSMPPLLSEVPLRNTIELVEPDVYMRVVENEKPILKIIVEKENFNESDTEIKEEKDVHTKTSEVQEEEEEEEEEDAEAEQSEVQESEIEEEEDAEAEQSEVQESEIEEEEESLSPIKIGKRMYFLGTPSNMLYHYTNAEEAGEVVGIMRNGKADFTPTNL